MPTHKVATPPSYWAQKQAQVWCFESLYGCTPLTRVYVELWVFGKWPISLAGGVVEKVIFGRKIVTPKSEEISRNRAPWPITRVLGYLEREYHTRAGVLFWQAITALSAVKYCTITHCMKTTKSCWSAFLSLLLWAVYLHDFIHELDSSTRAQQLFKLKLLCFIYSVPIAFQRHQPF